MSTRSDAVRRAAGARDVRDAIVVGGGPAGLVLGVLLARQGLRVTVLEKHADFLRDFRGDTVHPSTLRAFDELGWLDELLRLPHTLMPQAVARVGQRDVVLADFSRLPVPVPAIAFMPQWDLLDMVSARGDALPGFELRRSTSVDALLAHPDGRIAGVRASSPDGPVELRAKLVIGADGRHSTVRAAARLPLAASHPAIDVLWFRAPKLRDEATPIFNLSNEIVITIDRGDYLQVAHVVAAGSYDAVRENGIAAWRERIERAVPALAGAMGGVAWDDVHPLSVRVDRLRRWHGEGVLCIGDAAHAMSPAGGVGINLAVADAIATARIVGPVLARGVPTGRALDRVRRRRELPARVVQAAQVRMMEAFAALVGAGGKEVRVPFAIRLLERVPVLTRLTGWLLGMGVRPEHIDR